MPLAVVVLVFEVLPEAELPVPEAEFIEDAELELLAELPIAELLAAELSADIAVLLIAELPVEAALLEAELSDALFKAEFSVALLLLAELSLAPLLASFEALLSEAELPPIMFEGRVVVVVVVSVELSPPRCESSE